MTISSIEPTTIDDDVLLMSFFSLGATSALSLRLVTDSILSELVVQVDNSGDIDLDLGDASGDSNACGGDVRNAAEVLANGIDGVTTSIFRVKKTWKLIKDLQKTGNLLKRRQEYFEAEELSLEYLDSIIESFNPYRAMWTACSNFIKLEEITIGNPLNSIDLDEIKESITDLTKIMEKSVEVFEEKKEIKNIAVVFLSKIEQFNIIYETIECIKNENWLLLHWQELAQQSGIEIKFSPTMSFGYCIKKGILNHVPLVKKIVEKAILEADSIRFALEEEERLRQEAELALLEKKKNRKCRTDIL